MDTEEPGRIYEEARDEAREAALRTREALEGYLDRLESLIRQRPGTAVLAALGVGYVVGRLVRRGG